VADEQGGHKCVLFDRCGHVVSCRLGLEKQVKEYIAIKQPSAAVLQPIP
jgi:hypothetical protein